MPVAQTALLGTLGIRLTADAISLLHGMAEAEFAVISSSQKMLRQAGLLGAGLATAFAGIAGAGVRAFAQFDKAMTDSVSIMGDVSAEMRKELETTARVLATDTTKSAKELAEAYQFLASAGFDAKESQVALATVTKFSIAGKFGLEKATTLLADSTTALGLRSKDAEQNMLNMTRVSDVLTKANIIASGTTEDFAEALTNGPAAALRLAHKDLEEGVAVLAALASQNIKGAEAGTQFSIVMRDLQTKAIKNREEFAHFGIEVSDAGGKMNNLADIIGQLEAALGTMTPQQQKANLLLLGFSDRSLKSIQSLIGMSQQIRDYETALRGAGGTTKDVSDKVMTSFSDRLTNLKNNVNELLLSVGEGLTPTLVALTQTIKDFLKSNDEASSTIKSNMEAVGAAFVGVAKAAAFVFNGLMNFMRTVGIVILGVTNDIIAGIKEAVGFINKLIGMANKVRAHFGGELLEPIDINFTVGGQTMDQWMTTVEGAQKELWADLEKGAFKTAEVVPKAVRDAVRGVTQEVTAVVSDTADQIKQMSDIAMTSIDAMRARDRELGIQSPADAKRARGQAANAAIANPDVELQKGFQEEIQRMKDNLAELEAVGNAEVELTQEVQAEKLKAIQEYNDRLRALQMAQARIQLDAASQTFESLANITESFGARQSGVFKAMFAASKAFAIADATISIAQGLSKAASLGFPAGIIGMAQVAAATSTIVSSIQAVQLEFAGGRAAGGPVMPGKAFLVGERGPELFSPGSAGNITPNDRLGGKVNIVVNNFTDAQAEVRTTDNGDEKTVEIIIARTKNSIASDIRQGTGDVNRSMQSSFGLKRAGR